MSRTPKVVVAVVVVAGVAWTAASWYTGKRAEDEVRQRVADANTRLQTSFPGMGTKAEIVSYERGVFSSAAQFRVTFLGPAGTDGKPAQEDVLLNEKIYHGPFPFDLLRAGHVAPAMASTTFDVAENDLTKPWFAAAKGSPASGSAVIDYGGNAKGVVVFQPVDSVNVHGVTVKFSGSTLNVAVPANSKGGKVDGGFESLSIKTSDPESPLQVDVGGVTLASDMHEGKSGLQLGTSQLSVRQAVITPKNVPAVTLNGYVQKTAVDEGDTGLSGKVDYQVNMVNVGGKDMAGVQVSLAASNLAPDAVKSLANVYSRMLSRASSQPAGANGTPELPEMSPEDRAQAMSALQAMLASKPSISIDPVLVNNSKGQGRFTLKLDLAQPPASAQSIDQVVAQTIRMLDVKLDVSKALLASLLSQGMQLHGEDAAKADTEAGQQADLAGMMASSSGFAAVNGADIVSSLHYADNTVDLNGKKMPLQEFAGMVFAAALGGPGGPPDEDDDDDDQDSQQAPAPGAMPGMPAMPGGPAVPGLPPGMPKPATPPAGR
jgi:uncharacterized protein YdgA (DUF945 family)